MARTLIIKNADFSVNKVATVEIEEDVPCTGITLNESTSAITSINGTDTLTAATTPADTTDTVVWSTSNPDVATVAGGIVTATGCGTATITATCGSFSATCEVTVTHVAVLTFAKNMYVSKDNNKDYLSGGTALDKYAVGYSSSGTLRLTYENNPWYGVEIPNGANTISITAAGAYKTYGFWVSTDEACTASQIIALAYDKNDFGTPTNYSGVRTVSIPDRTTGTYEGMNAVVFMFRYDATVTDTDTGNISATFSRV